MKSAALLLWSIALGTACLFGAAGLGSAHTVYLLPMANGLDQYLAHRITESGLLQVVVDPKKADLILTDRLGEALEERLKALSPDASEQKPAGDNNAARPPAPSGFARSKGTVFLVDRASGNVVWSAYEPPRRSTPEELDRVARRVVEQLKAPRNSR
ncbi:MAG: hypothetical protein IT159_01170 [Bryobacterales bacterium]|nr:hypothetical protein [Bryobacterales bacterium]